MIRRQKKPAQPRVAKKKSYVVDANGARAGELSEKQPYWDIVTDAWVNGEDVRDPRTSPGTMVLEDGRTEIVVKVTPPSRMLMAEENLAARHYDLKAVLQVGVPEHERARIYVRVSPLPADKFQQLTKGDSGNNAVAQYLVAKRLERLDRLRRKGVLKEWTFYITCTVRPPQPFGPAAPPSPTLLRQTLRRALSRRSELINRLRNAGYEAEPMSAQDVFKEAWYYNNLGGSHAGLARGRLPAALQPSPSCLAGRLESSR